MLLAKYVERIYGMNINGQTSIDIQQQSEGLAEDKNYRIFVDKFKPKKTTDDCYTPELVYEAVKSFVVNEYNLQDIEIIRPFYPGGDYENFRYPDNCVVIDNPPFSILSKIARFYHGRNIKYFLFAPTLTLYSVAAGECNYLPTGNMVVYDNGASVNTSFITNMGAYKIDTAPTLYKAVEDAAKQTVATKKMPKYEYPDNVFCARDAKLSGRGISYRVKSEQCKFIRALDVQKSKGKTIYGSGFLLSDKAAAERAAAERAVLREAQVWDLSQRERDIIETLNHTSDN